MTLVTVSGSRRIEYERQRDRLHEELTLADLELREAQITGIDIEGILGFAEHLINNIGRIWTEAKLPQRQQIQTAIFPEGLPFDGREFGTAPTCIAFSYLRDLETVENGMASPRGTNRFFRMELRRSLRAA